MENKVGKRTWTRSVFERRTDNTTSDLVDVALLYYEVFGPRATKSYLVYSPLPTALCQRILHNSATFRYRPAF